MKRGIFGGSFNPPHNFHLEIANYLINNHILDEVVFVPTGREYPKDGLIDDRDRLEMVSLAITDNDKLKVSDYETGSHLISTYQTLDYFHKNGDDIYFICGTDNLLELDTWDQYEYILSNYIVLVIKRNHDNIDNLLKKYSKFKSHIIVCDMEGSPISSTMIRDKIKNGMDVSDYLDSRVYEYIKHKKLYK